MSPYLYAHRLGQIIDIQDSRKEQFYEQFQSDFFIFRSSYGSRTFGRLWFKYGFNPGGERAESQVQTETQAQEASGSQSETQAAGDAEGGMRTVETDKGTVEIPEIPR